MEVTLDQAWAAFIQDIRDIVAQYELNSNVITEMVEALNTYDGHVRDLLGLPDPPTPDPDPEPDPEPDPTPGFNSLPVRPPTNDFSNRAHPYALQGDGLDVSDKELYGVSSSCAYLSNSELRNFVCYGSGGDGIKWNYGSLLLEDGHIHTMGLNAGAHADGIQARGNGTTMTCRRVFFDMPTNLGDGSKSNACVLLQSATGPMGVAIFEECIFRGGNYSVVTSAKKTNNKVAQVIFKNCIFVVEKDSPRFGLLSLQGLSNFDDCEVMALESNGTLTHLTDDPAGFNFKAWHQAKYGRNPIS